MVLLGMADEISAHFIDRGMSSCSVSLWAVLGTKVLRGLSCRFFAFTGTFSLQSSLSFTSSLSSTPGTIPLRFLNRSFLCSAVSAARRTLSLSFLRRRRSSCSCADLRPLLELLRESMFKKVVSKTMKKFENSGNVPRVRNVSN